MIKVTEEGDSFHIEWDPDDPLESVFNDWDEKQFKDVILNACIEILQNYKEEDNPMAK